MTDITELRLTGDGRVCLISGNNSRVFDFNEYYRNYFPSCRWTAAGRGDLLYLAGTDGEGMPHLFSSTGGEVWTERNIRSRTSLVDPGRYGDILRILTDASRRQIYLVAENGYLVTLPDCPKCMRARKISDRKLAAGRLEEDTLVLVDEEGTEILVPTASAAQYRCAWTFAKPLLGAGGLLLDLRTREEQQELPVRAAIRMEASDVEGLLGRMPKERPLFFFCGHGYVADEAVRTARERGFVKSYSLGGVYDLLEGQEA